jgi:G patch domain/KOW motif-containing protein
MGGDGAKTVFSFSKKSAKAKNVGVAGKVEDAGANREFLTGMTGSGLQLKDAKVAEVKSITLQSNTFEVGTGRQRKAPSFLPDESAIAEDRERFEVAERISAGGETAQGAGVTYGLTKMGPKDGAVKKETKPGGVDGVGVGGAFSLSLFGWHTTEKGELAFHKIAF